MTEPLRMPPDEFALMKEVAQVMGIAPAAEMTPEQAEEFSQRFADALAATPPRMRHRIIQRPSLSRDEVRQLLRECVTVVAPGETLVLRIGEEWHMTPNQMREISDWVNYENEDGPLFPFRTLVVPGTGLGVVRAEAGHSWGPSPQDKSVEWCRFCHVLNLPAFPPSAHCTARPADDGAAS